MEPKTENRKTFRLDADVAQLLASTPGYSNENAALNGLLRELPRQLERSRKGNDELLAQRQAAEADARIWKQKHQDTRDELRQLREALQVVGAALFPAHSPE